MSRPYQVLARKWRPQRFDDVVGQVGVTQTLRNAIQRGRIAQSFIFSGARGVGKTTTARILARALNCETGPTAEPCGTCDACVELDDVDVAPFGDLDARVTGAAGIGGRPGDAVQAAGENARGGRLADAAGPREDERLRNPLGRDGVAERLRDTALPDDVIELLRAPLPRENLICHLR